MVERLLNDKRVGAVAVALAVTAAAAIYFLLIRSDDQPECENVVTFKVTDEPVTPERYDEAIEGLQQVQDLARDSLSAEPDDRSELLDQAFEVFYASSDNLMHDADLQLCEADYDFAEQIRNDMLALEVAIGNQNNPQTILDLADMLQGRLEEAKEILF